MRHPSQTLEDSALIFRDQLGKKSLAPTKNRFEPLTDESDSDLGEDEIGKIVKERKKGAIYKEKLI